MQFISLNCLIPLVQKYYLFILTSKTFQKEELEILLLLIIAFLIYTSKIQGSQLQQQLFSQSMKDIGKSNTRNSTNFINFTESCLPFASNTELGHGVTESIKIPHEEPLQGVRNIKLEPSFFRKSHQNESINSANEFSTAYTKQKTKNKKPVVINLESSDDQNAMQVDNRNQDSQKNCSTQNGKKQGSSSPLKNSLSSNKVINGEKCKQLKSSKTSKICYTHQRINKMLHKDVDMKLALQKYLPNNLKAWIQEMSENDIKQSYISVVNQLTNFQKHQLKFKEIEEHRNRQASMRKKQKQLLLQSKKNKMLSTISNKTKKQQINTYHNLDSQYENLEGRQNQNSKINQSMASKNAQSKMQKRQRNQEKKRKTYQIISYNEYSDYQYYQCNQQVQQELQKSDSLKYRHSVDETIDSTEGMPKKKVHKQTQMPKTQLKKAYNQYMQFMDKIEVIIEQFQPASSQRN